MARNSGDRGGRGQEPGSKEGGKPTGVGGKRARSRVPIKVVRTGRNHPRRTREIIGRKGGEVEKVNETTGGTVSPSPMSSRPIREKFRRYGNQYKRRR